MPDGETLEGEKPTEGGAGDSSAKMAEEEAEEEEESLPGCTLFIKNLNFDTTEETLKGVSDCCKQAGAWGDSHCISSACERDPCSYVVQQTAAAPLLCRAAPLHLTRDPSSSPTTWGLGAGGHPHVCKETCQDIQGGVCDVAALYIQKTKTPKLFL